MHGLKFSIFIERKLLACGRRSFIKKAKKTGHEFKFDFIIQANK